MEYKKDISGGTIMEGLISGEFIDREGIHIIVNKHW